jgi:chromosome partitioning protein
MGRIIAIANQKGGVGKTTTSVNLAGCLAFARQHVLLVDIDPQGNATMGSGVNKNLLAQSIYDVLLAEVGIREAILPVSEVGYELIPANGDLTAAEVELIDAPRKEQRLREVLTQIQSNYDYIFIDCPPSLSMLTVNALVAADSVTIPIQCEYYALEGLTALIATIEKIRTAVNPRLTIDGLLRTMFDPRNRLSTDVSMQLIEHFGDKVYRTVIPRNVRLAEAPSHGLPIVHYDRNSRGALAYQVLASEIMSRHSERQHTASVA